MKTVDYPIAIQELVPKLKEIIAEDGLITIEEVMAV
jgi:PII-like signaling protein